MAFEADGKFEQIARKLAIEGFQTSLLNIKVELDKAYYVLLYNFVREMSQAGLTKQVAEKKKILSYLAKMKTLAIEGVAGTQNSILILFESYIESVDAEHDVKICFEVSRDTETTKYIKAEKQWWDLTIDNEEKLKNYAVAAKSSFYKTVNLRKRLDEKLNVYVNVEVEEDWGIDDKYWGKDTYCIKDLAKNGAYLKLVYLPSYYGYLGIKCSGDNLVYPEIPVLKQK